MKKLSLVILIAAGAAVLIFVLSRDDGERIPGQVSPGAGFQVGTKIGNLAPDFELPDYEGRTVALSDFRGQKAVFVNFWASWCPFCVEEMPLLAAVQEKFSGRYATLAINRGEDLSTAKEFSDKVGVTGRMTFLLDKNDSLYGRYGGFAMPYSLFIDKDGVIRDLKLGPLTEKELEEKIQKIISNQ